MNEIGDIEQHLIDNNCELISNRSSKHSLWVNKGDRSLKSALLKESNLSDKYVKNVCKCLGIPSPILCDIRQPE